MRVYAAIGHFKGSKNMTSVAMTHNTKKGFITDLHGNEFVPYIVITEKMLKKLFTCDSVFEQVKKMTSNYRIWNDVCDYIGQCGDILEEKNGSSKGITTAGSRKPLNRQNGG